MYAIKVNTDGRLIHATYPVYACNIAVAEPENHAFNQEEMMEGYILSSTLPGENLPDYRYVDGNFVYDPLPAEEEKPSLIDMIEAQITYTAMMTDTLLEV